MQEPDVLYMQRCLDLAVKGAGYVAPNPMVGAVLVHDNRIIGEGYHRQYGEAHAEVNCIQSVSPEDRPLISSSTLYVSLEPCAHYGKTPPCSDLIIQYAIPKVVVGCRDPFPEVDGKGISKLLAAGVEVKVGVLEKECRELNKRFFCQVEKRRPYIILKWAQTADGFIAGNGSERLLISNDITNRLVHQWRSEEAAILVGTNTAILDDPALTNRLWKGRSPVRMVLDRSLRLPGGLKLLDGAQDTIVLNTIKSGEQGKTRYYKIDPQRDLIEQVLKAANENNLQSILVEGGAKLLQSFMDAGAWDEARVITNKNLFCKAGIQAPVLRQKDPVQVQYIQSDNICTFINTPITL